MQPLIGLLLVACLQYASGAIHSWKAYYTGTSGLTEFPEFVALNVIDDRLMGYFDSKTNRFKSQFQWMEDNLGKNYDDQETNTLQGVSASFKNNVKVAMERFNQTQGIHTFQQMYGCEWDDTTGATDGFYQFAYDGEDLIAFDLKNLRWVSPQVQAFLITEGKWNKDQGLIEGRNNYLKNICIEWLKKYMDYGKTIFERTVSPQVSLLRKSSSSPVVCHATGFYPSGITISWMRNGEDHHDDVDLGELLPNSDGTFQKTSTLKVTPDEWKNNKFSCVVEHQDKIKTAKDIFTNEESLPIGIIVGAVAAVVLLVVIGVAGFLMYQKKKGFKPVSGSDDGSNSSAHTVPQA